MRIEEDVKLDYKDVLIRPKRSTLSSRSEVDITRTINFKASKQSITAIPIIAANMDGIGTFAMARAFIKQKMFVALHKHYSVPELKKFFESLKRVEAPYVFYTMGIRDADIKKLDALLKVVNEEKIASICIDVANGYTERFVEFAKQIRARFPKKIIMAGNVVTGEIVEELALAGVDIIKVGIGPGSVCTTRKMTGIGYPQLSAVIECADAAHGIGAHICADGGCQVPGDVAKAFGGGGDFVMIGSMLAGHAESELEHIEIGGVDYVQYCGSSSREAMMKHSGGIAGYRASEGKCVEVPYKGPVENTLQDILGGLRSACTYVGAKKLKELPKRTTFIRVTQQLNPQYDEQQLKK
ncbi:MAG: GMP reductase [bacterium]|nr:GMP reductase [bacterium]